MIGLLAFALAAPVVSAADQAAIYKASGAVRARGRWTLCADDPRQEPATIEPQGDLNGDGRPEAVVIQNSLFCYGQTETGFVLLSQLAGGGWGRIHQSEGVPSFLKTKGTGGWPDMSVGGPGFCFPVMRWNGKAYALHRKEYEGKRCR